MSLAAATKYFFEQAAEGLNLEPGVRQLLETPQREVMVQVPVVKDDGTLEVYLGFRVQQTTLAAPSRAASGSIPVWTWMRFVAWQPS